MDANNDNNEIKDIYIKMKAILSGCRHISDAHYLANQFIEKYPQYKDFIYGLVYGKTYEDELSMQMLRLVVSEISRLEYTDDVINVIDTRCSEKKITSIQNRTFLRLSKMKKDKPFVPNNVYRAVTGGKIIKKCPHCKHEREGCDDTNYVICGYRSGNSHGGGGGGGYDLRGCQRDWCFRCGKMLCKNWSEHQLFVKSNRYHVKSCCMQYALENNLNYMKDMCQCNNEHVNRSSNDIIDRFTTDIDVDFDMEFDSLSTSTDKPKNHSRRTVNLMTTDGNGLPTAAI